ncbi:unnamed protein product [Effrenium voratum]|nr:unnamed protein product [Effrenium voratum]
MEPVRWRKQRRQPEVQPPECLEEATGLVRYLAQSAAQRRNATLQQLLELPPQQRHAAMAELRARKVEEEMRAEGKCEKCMMQLKYCVCPSLETLRSDSVGAGTSAPLRFVVWMHHKERRRASNTGKLLKLLLPDVTDILIHGVAEDDRRLEEIIQNSGGHAFVVYPSDDADAQAFRAFASRRGAASRPIPVPLASAVPGGPNQHGGGCRAAAGGASGHGAQATGSATGAAAGAGGADGGAGPAVPPRYPLPARSARAHWQEEVCFRCQEDSEAASRTAWHSKLSCRLRARTKSRCQECCALGQYRNLYTRIKHEAGSIL